jgi:ABC-type branched-subunit amino acid transport system substrate-binding protein
LTIFTLRRFFMKRILIFIAILALSFVLVQGAFARGGKPAEEIKVGTLLSHTGPLKEFGPAIQNGAVLAANQLGEAGLTIKLIHEDSETSAIPAANAARKLVEIDKVVAVIGALSSGVTMPTAESVTIPAGVIQISPASTSPMITALPADQGKDYLFRTCPSDALQGVIAGRKAAEMIKTASVLYVNNPYGQGLAEEFKKAFEASGGRILEMVPHDERAAESYTAELRKALAGDPEALAAYSYPEHAKVYLKEAIEFFNYRSFFFCDGTKSLDIVEALGAENVEGMMGTAPGSAGGRALQQFEEAYAAEFGERPPLPFITNAYDGVAVVGLAAYAAIQKGLDPTSENIRNNLRKVSSPPGQIILPGEFKKAFDLLKQGKQINYEGAAGAVDFDRNGYVVTPIEVWKYSGGDIVTVSMEEL